MHKQEFNIIAATVFGLESVVKEECQNLGFKNIKVYNGKVEFTGDERTVVIANLWLRSAERIYIKLIEFDAYTFDDIYNNIKQFDWENYLSENGKILVSGKSINSKLMSVSDNQSITKKAIIDRLSEFYNKQKFLENEEDYKIKISISKNKATVTLDTSGTGLHKRGYRTKQNKAPIKETLAAAMILLSDWTPNRPFVDLFCGSGTLPIEAALIGKNIAPGISREFDFMNWRFFNKEIYKEEKVKAYQKINDIKLDIIGFDIDKDAIEISRKNSINAGVDEDVQFVIKDVKKVGLLNNFGVIVSNPPYGERIGDESDMKNIYESISKLLKNLTTWSSYFITSDKNFEFEINKIADKKRKLYNGRIEVDYYQYEGFDPKQL